ncbi:transporter substrate-binding domain-containing protein [Oscillospiraceae bacterium WX1]
MKKIFVLAIALFMLLGLSACSKTPANTVFSTKDLTGKNIGVVKNSAAVVLTAGYGTQHPYDVAETMLVDLKNGGLDCAVMDETAAKAAVRKVSHVKILSQPVYEADFCFAIAKENPDLKEAVDSALQQLKKSGTLKKIIDGYSKQNGYRYTSPSNADHSVGTLTLAVGGAFAPYCYQDEKGAYVGIDIDVARAVCDILRVDMKVSETKRDNLVTIVQFGKADFSLGGVTNNENDAKLVDFSNPYTTSTQVIIVRK